MVANGKSERIWILFFKYVMFGSAASTVLFSAISIVICQMKIGHFDAKHVYLPYKAILPWNQQTPIGLLCEFMVQFAVAESYWINCGSILLLFISINLHNRAFFEMFRHLLQTLDWANERNEQHLLHELIHFHNSVKE